MPRGLAPKAGSTVDMLLHGTKWKHEYARLALPILVQWAEMERIDPARQTKEHTYKELAIAVRQPRQARNIDKALGVIGEAIKELNELHPALLPQKIPPIELLVWTKGRKRPGDSGFYFVGLSKEKVQHRTEAELQALASVQRARITGFAYWRRVLAIFGSKPRMIKLPPAKVITSKPGFGGMGGGESHDHHSMKHYLAEHYSALGISGRCAASLEETLLSADRLDLLLERKSGDLRIAVEVKSRISGFDDLLRGVFQCVKYRALLEAQEDYGEATEDIWTRRSIEVILATEDPLPDAIAKLAGRLGVTARVVRVPATYIAPP